MASLRRPLSIDQSLLTRESLPVLFGVAAALLAALSALIYKFLGLLSSHGAAGRYAARFFHPEYLYTILQPNYIDDGFVRRGIPGTIALLFRSPNMFVENTSFQIFSAIWIAIPLIILLRRVARSDAKGWIWLATVLVLAPQLFLAWREDIGRGDMLVDGVIAWAVLACLDRRYLLAAVILVIGSQVHEAVVIFGAPLCAAVAFLDVQRGEVELRRCYPALAALPVLLGLVLLIQHLLAPQPGVLARHLLSRVPHTDDYLLPIYMTVGGTRTLISSFCFSHLSPKSYLYEFSVFPIFALYGFVLPAVSRLRLGLFAFVGFLPLIVMTIIAIDWGRWLSFAVFNWWMVNAVLQARGVDVRQTTVFPRWYSIAAGVVLLAMGPGKVPAANQATFALAGKLWPRPDPKDGLSICDPTWRSVILSGRP